MEVVGMLFCFAIWRALHMLIVVLGVVTDITKGRRMKIARYAFGKIEIPGIEAASLPYIALGT